MRDDVLLQRVSWRLVRRRKNNLPSTMSSSEMTARSGVSMSSSASGWGDGDAGMGMTGVHLRVLGGRSVWPLAFHELASAGNRRNFVEQRMADVDFSPDPLGPRMAGALFLTAYSGEMQWIGQHAMCRQTKSIACWQHSVCITFGCDV